MLQIIESREKDIDALRNLYLGTRVKAFSWVDTSQFKLSDFERETDGEYILVALDGELLVGFVSIWVADNFIHHLYVDEKYQSKNIGSELLKTVIDSQLFGIAREANTLSYTNQSSIEFWISF